MKNKIAIASAFLAASSFSMGEIVINDFLSFEGFVDMSYSHTDMDSATDNQNSFQIDQVEISWLFDFERVTAQVDFDAESSNGSNGDDVYDLRFPGSGLSEIEVEQAFATYHFDNGGAITAGRYASMLGFEAFEPTGLYQWSTAYSFFGGSLGAPLYAQGVKYTQEGDNTFFGLSLQDTGGLGVAGANTLGGSDDLGFGDGFGLEIAGAYYMDNGLSFFLGGAYDDNDNLGDAYIVNGYVSFETGAWIFAAELNYVDTDFDGGLEQEELSGLVMANFAYSDQASVTGRISFSDFENNGAGDNDGQAYTLAHNYAFTDNLLLVTEVSYVEQDNVGAEETLVGAVELLFSF